MTAITAVKKVWLGLVAICWAASGTCGGDWPMYRGDAARSGRVADPLAAKLTLKWVRRANHPPRPAWPRSTRLKDDRAYHVVVADDTVFFGSSADCHVYALDAATGAVRWSFATGGPVRFAPAVWRSRDGQKRTCRLFVAGDDGFLYCLDAATGRVIWTRRGGPDERMLLGNGRMISRWPTRGAPAVVGDVVYFAAGIWPTEGIYVYALEAATGKPIWCNSKAGSIYMPQPHGGANAHSGISAQGYLAVAGDRLFVPTGQAVPACLDRRDGKLRYFHLQPYGQLGGSSVAVIGGRLFNEAAVFDAATGRRLKLAAAAAVAAMGDGIVYCHRGQVRHLDADGTTVKWSVKTPAGGSSVIVAGATVVCGGKGKVATIDTDAHKAVWTAQVDGEALGLASAGGRLWVSTDTGSIYCFAPPPAGPAEAPREIRPVRADRPYGANTAATAAAKALLAKTGVSEGYCLAVGCGDGALAFELAKRTTLRIYAVDPDPANVAAARRKLTAAGLYGVRVTVHQAKADEIPYASHFADLAVSARSAAGDEIMRLLRPGGGVLCTGAPGKLTCRTRGPLGGAGTWTHQYADAANTICSADTIVRGPLSLLWFGSPDLGLPNRHGRGHAPLYHAGRLIVQGVDGLRALDAYNGRVLWTYPLPGVLKPFHQEHLMGTAGTGSNYCLGGGSVFVHTRTGCLRIDAATGRKTAEYAAPAKELPDGRPGRWGYIAFHDATLFGTLVDDKHLVPYRFGRSNMNGMFTEGHALFAVDVKTARVKWRYDAKESIRHNTVAVCGGRVFLIDRKKAVETRSRRALTKPQPGGELIALDAGTGKPVWRNAEDIYGTMVAVSKAHDVLLMCYQSTRFQLNSELGGRMTAFRASTGKKLWDIEAGYASRPLINGRTIYAQPHAWDLLTGKQKTVAGGRPWTFDRSYGCGTISASVNLLLFRSATLGYRDLLADRPTANYGGIRPGCWINTIPAGGLVLMPDATTGCRCSYLTKATIALQPTGLWPPDIRPAGGSYREPVRVDLGRPPAGTEIRYTLDGREPGAGSAVFSGPVTLGKTGVVKARIFRNGRGVSDIAAARFVIDRAILPIGLEHWRVWDAPGATSGPSRWAAADGTVVQLSNIFRGSASAAGSARPRYGTMLIYKDKLDTRRGELTLEINSRDDDELGVAFRLKDPQHHYLWVMDRQRSMHVLACRNGESYRVLAENKNGYQSGRWYNVRIALDGPKIAVHVDGRKDLEAEDKTFSGGTVALHVWGNTGSFFRNVRWLAAKPGRPDGRK